MGEAVQRELERNRQRKAVEQAEAERQVEESARLSAEHRELFEESDQGAAHRQIEAAERAMRGPGIVPGYVVGDPTAGPAIPIDIEDHPSRTGRPSEASIESDPSKVGKTTIGGSHGRGDEDRDEERDASSQD